MYDNITRLCRPYSPSSREYAFAFELFRQQSDQKERAKEAILKLFAGREFNTIIDVGAGDGVLTKMIAENFRSKILIEPNQLFAYEASELLPDATIIQRRVQDVHCEMTADVVLLSHVLYHVEYNEWHAVLRKCKNFLTENGLLVLLLQSRDSDFMKILDSFHIQHQYLDYIVEQKIEAEIGMQICHSSKIPSFVNCKTSDEIIEVGQFVLNSRSNWAPFAASDLLQAADRVTETTELPRRISCTQDLFVLSNDAPEL